MFNQILNKIKKCGIYHKSDFVKTKNYDRFKKVGICNIKNAAFTLIEVIVVMAVIAILVLLAQPFYRGYTKEAKITAARHDARVIENSVEEYLIQNEILDSNITSEPVDNNFLQDIADKGNLIDTRGPVIEGINNRIFYNVPNPYVKSDLLVNKNSKSNVYVTDEGYVVIDISNTDNPNKDTEGDDDIKYSDVGYFRVDENGMLTNFYPNGKDGTLPTLYDIVIPKTYPLESTGEIVTVTDIDEYVFENLSWKRTDITSVILPDTIRTIGKSAFAGNLIKEVVLPDNLVSIGNNAFVANFIESVIIPDNVQYIGEAAFNNNQIASIVIGSGLTALSPNIFSENKIAEVVVPGNIKVIGERAFAANEPMKSVIVENGVQRIETDAFRYNNIEILSLGNSVEYIGNHAFSYNEYYDFGKIAELKLPDNLIEIGDFAFHHNKITSLIIPDKVKGIGRNAFSGNEIVSLLFESNSSLETVGQHAFSQHKLTELRVPGSLRNIGPYAFGGNGLNQLVIEEGVTELLNPGIFSFSASWIDGTTSTVVLPISLTYVADVENSISPFGSIEGWNVDVKTFGYGGEWTIIGQTHTNRLYFEKN